MDDGAKRRYVVPVLDDVRELQQLLSIKAWLQNHDTTEACRDERVQVWCRTCTSCCHVMAGVAPSTTRRIRAIRTSSHNRSECGIGPREWRVRRSHWLRSRRKCR